MEQFVTALSVLVSFRAIVIVFFLNQFPLFKTPSNSAIKNAAFFILFSKCSNCTSVKLVGVYECLKMSIVICCNCLRQSHAIAIFACKM